MAASVKTRKVAPSKSYPAARNVPASIIGGGQSIYEESATQQFPLGYKVKVGPDRTLVYASAGEALYAGHMCAQALVCGATTTLQNTNGVAVAAAVGDTRIYIVAGTTAQAAGVFDDGYIDIHDDTTTGANFLYKIKHSSALATSGTSSYVDLYDPIHIALTTSDQVALTANLYKSVILSDATQASMALGIAPINVTSTYYFWLQTWGPAPCYPPETALVNTEPVTMSDNADGGVGPVSSHTNLPHVGHTIHVGTLDEGAIIFLRLDP